MLSSITRSCFTAALLFTSSLADSVAIAFANPAFAGITFGQPFTISWFGGDGTPVQIDLLTGNPAILQPVTTLASNYSGSAISWTPVPSQSIRSGQLYALSIVQSGLTNYSPMFGIGGSNAVSRQIFNSYGAPVPMGTGRYYPIASRVIQVHAKAHNSDFRLFNTEPILPRHYGTETPTGTGTPYVYGPGTEVFYVAAPTGTEFPAAYATGTTTGSADSHRGAALESSSPIAPALSGSSKLSLGWFAVVKAVSSGMIALLLWM
ncbi:MAG: hypothetical protein Q9170_005470 [Blastenia crenularia]